MGDRYVLGFAPALIFLWDKFCADSSKFLWMKLLAEVLRVYMHAKRSHTHIKYPVVHVSSVDWKQQNNPAHTKSVRIFMLSCTVYERRKQDGKWHPCQSGSHLLQGHSDTISVKLEIFMLACMAIVFLANPLLQIICWSLSSNSQAFPDLAKNAPTPPPPPLPPKAAKL